MNTSRNVGEKEISGHVDVMQATSLQFKVTFRRGSNSWFSEWAVGLISQAAAGPLGCSPHGCSTTSRLDRERFPEGENEQCAAGG